jgi:hypothetical protein
MQGAGTSQRTAQQSSTLYYLWAVTINPAHITNA